MDSAFAGVCSKLAFVLALCEVNALQALKHLHQRSCSLADFRLALVQQLLDKAARVRSQAELEHASSPAVLKIDNNNIVGPQLQAAADLATSPTHSWKAQPAHAGKWQGNGWQRVKSKWQKQLCEGCPRQTRGYCKCDPSKSMCKACFLKHVSGFIAK